MSIQELEENFRRLQAEADELSKQSKALDARLQDAYSRQITASNDDLEKIEEEIASLEQEEKALSKRTIHALNLANEAVVAWQKAEEAQKRK